MADRHQNGDEPGLSLPLLFFAASILPHVLGGIVTNVIGSAMAGSGELAAAAQAAIGGYRSAFNIAAYGGVTVASVLYMWRPVRFLIVGGTDAEAEAVRRKLISAPVVLAALSAVPWLASVPYFNGAIVTETGQWSSELVSQFVITPLISGSLAVLSTYIGLDAVVRSRLADFLYGETGLAGRKRLVPGVRARLVVLMAALGFAPAFTMIGLINATESRILGGASAVAAIDTLSGYAGRAFLFFSVLGIAFTFALARSLTRPLSEMASAVQKIAGGGSDVRVAVSSDDEVGVLAEAVNDLAATLEDRDRILDRFGRVVEPQVRDKLLAGGDALEGEERIATLLFCDLRGFTGLAESAPPREVVASLNAFFEDMSATVHRHGGYVDKFIGDALLAVFGLFDADDVEDGRGARRAIACALEMSGAEVGATVGVHTGSVVAGAIGSAARHEYTVIGDAVNVAARLQAACRDQDSRLIVSNDAVEASGRNGEALGLEAREAIALRGRAQSLDVWRR